MKGFGGMLTFEIQGGLPAARKFLKAVKVFACAESLGGVESLIEHPAIMTHASVPPETRAALGISDGFIRLSVGIEDVQDLIDDLAQALGAPKGKGAVVKRVLLGGPAEKAGIQPNDVIVRFGDTTVGDLQHLLRLVLDAPVERPVSIRVLRQGKEVQVSVTITEAPAERPGAS